MAEGDLLFRYVAIDARGQRVRGLVDAASDINAFERLRRSGLSPLTIRRHRGRGLRTSTAKSLTDREAAELLGNLGDLLKAGADMRSALEILASRSARPAVKDLCQTLSTEISRGDALEQAFADNLGRRHGFVAALVAAGEAAGDLSGGLLRAAEMIDARVRVRGKLVSVLAYPSFVLVSTLAAVLALLLFVVPALAPLTRDMGAEPPLTLTILIWLSDGLQTNMRIIELALAAGLITLLLAGRTGALARTFDRLSLTGPTARIASGLVFGGFAIALGGMLSAGAPMSETLRLAVRSVRSPLARKRLESVLAAVRQGHALSSSLEEVSGFPSAIVRLAAVGEATGALGPMLVRGGKLEEDAAMRRIETIGGLLGPILIVALGGLVGLLMAGLLSGVSQLGQSTLQ